ncbi:TPA: hypothetical protein DEO28_04200 [Candidatus Dependentiae bacterium]|nr:MAG: hypothetical protein UR14_C0006G0076 [candidate division TM6 bacterium GW2011_GWE2_31_21]KKP53501.1 MAG: hypothetical protein UR43_C0004G0042 [candidate division TM6 bacterium GW2011_GWF2_33_332]HBS48259.1 hypothetical protein [Candidatus Dependentiae bacterium]HBZ73685.1 hypothetical protein [Candidatus Dependentiae bacterium]
MKMLKKLILLLSLFTANLNVLSAVTYQEFKQDKESFLQELQREYPFVGDLIPFWRNLLIVCKAKLNPELLNRPYVKAIVNKNENLNMFNVDRLEEYLQTNSLGEFWIKYFDLTNSNIKDFISPEIWDNQNYWRLINDNFDRIKLALNDRSVKNGCLFDFTNSSQAKIISDLGLKKVVNFSDSSSTIAEFLKNTLLEFGENPDDFYYVTEKEIFNNEFRLEFFKGFIKRIDESPEGLILTTPFGYLRLQGNCHVFLASESIFSVLPETEKKALLLHELGHKKTNDYFLPLFSGFAQATLSDETFKMCILPLMNIAKQIDEFKADLFMACCGKKYRSKFIDLLFFAQESLEKSGEKAEAVDPAHPSNAKRIDAIKMVGSQLDAQGAGENVLAKLKENWKKQYDELLQKELIKTDSK